MIKDYYTLTKPGIVYGNALTAIAGFLVASRGDINVGLLLLTVIGISLVIASGCVFNNYIDRDIDAKMDRTKHRVLVRGTITTRNALIYGTILGVLGLSILFTYTNGVTGIVSFLGLFVYVVFYSLWLKRVSIYGVHMGSVAGAVPLLVGYLSVSGVIDIGAIILFCILALWQMPHSYAIGIYRLHDYQNAKIPVLPAQKGIMRTKVEIIIYTVLFVFATLLLTSHGYTGWIYFLVMAVMGVLWLLIESRGLYMNEQSDKVWAKQVFLFSIFVLVTFCVVIFFERIVY